MEEAGPPQRAGFSMPAAPAPGLPVELCLFLVELGKSRVAGRLQCHLLVPHRRGRYCHPLFFLTLATEPFMLEDQFLNRITCDIFSSITFLVIWFFIPLSESVACPVVVNGFAYP